MAAIRRWMLVALAAVAVTLLVQGVALACPNCKEALAQNDPHAAGLVRGYFWSILFMMSMPFLIFFTLGGYFWYQIRRARRLQAAAQLVAPRAESIEGGAASPGVGAWHHDPSPVESAEREPVGV